jgi:HTH-type transcriptional regulator/antitoxin HipB
MLPIADATPGKMFIRTPKELGALIRDRRKRLGLDQSELAVKVGVSRQWIIEIEKGKPRAAVGLVFRTLEALGVKVAIDERKENPHDVDVPDIDAIVARARKRRR